MSTSLSWRAAHHWLRGYSDAKAGRPDAQHDPLHAGYGDVYKRGYDVGSGVLPEPALASSGKGGCDA